MLPIKKLFTKILEMLKSHDDYINKQPPNA